MTKLDAEQRELVDRYAKVLAITLAGAGHREPAPKQAAKAHRPSGSGWKAGGTLGVHVARRYRAKLIALKLPVPNPPAAIVHLFPGAEAAVAETEWARKHAVMPEQGAYKDVAEGAKRPDPGASQQGKPSQSVSWPVIVIGAGLLIGVLTLGMGSRGATLVTGLLLGLAAWFSWTSASRATSRMQGQALRQSGTRLLIAALVLGGLLVISVPTPSELVDLTAATEPSTTAGRGDALREPLDVLASPAILDERTDPGVDDGLAAEHALVSPDPVSSSAGAEVERATDADRDSAYGLGVATHVHLVPEAGARLLAVRLGESDWTDPPADGVVAVNPSNDLGAPNLRATERFEVRLDVGYDLSVVLGGQVVRGMSTTIILDHPVSGFKQTVTSDGNAAVQLNLAARSQSALGGSFTAAVHASHMQRLPGTIALGDGAHTVTVSHLAPSRIDPVAIDLTVDGRDLYLHHDDLEFEVTVRPTFTLSILNLSPGPLRVNGHLTTTRLTQLSVPQGAEAHVVGANAEFQWSSTVATPTMLVVGDHHEAWSTNGRQDVAAACESRGSEAFGALGLDAPTYPRNTLWNRTVVTEVIDEGAGTAIRTARLEAQTASGRPPLRLDYECRVDHSSGQIVTFVVTSDDLHRIVPSMDLDVTLQGAHDAVMHVVTARTHAVDVLVLGDGEGHGAHRPIAFIPIGRDAARFRVDDVTVVVPVVVYANIRFVAADPEAHVRVETDAGETISGIHEVVVRAPVGTVLTASAEPTGTSRFLPASPVVVHAGLDRTVNLEMRRLVTVALGSDVPGATLRVPGVVEDPTPLPATIDVVQDEAYRIIIDPPDDSWFGIDTSMRFNEDSSVTPDLPRAASITFTSDPAGATIIVGGRPTSTTPVTHRFPVGSSISYQIAASPPHHMGYSGELTVTGDVVHPTYLERYPETVPSAVPPQATPRMVPRTAAPELQTTTPRSATRLFDSASGRPAPHPGESIRATPQYVVAFLANELEIRDVPCPDAPVPVMVCGVSNDGEATIAALVDVLFDVYLQPSSREVRWYRDRGSNAYVGAFRRPEGVYAVSVFGSTLSIAYIGP